VLQYSQGDCSDGIKRSPTILSPQGQSNVHDIEGCES
jgi:hypothetical protein